MESINAELWTYWGILLLCIAGGYISSSIGFYYKNSLNKDTGLLVFGSCTNIFTLLYGIIWAIVGPFSIHWILIPVGLIGAMFLIGHNEYQNELITGDEWFRGSLWLFITIFLAYLVAFNDTIYAKVAPAPKGNTVKSTVVFSKSKGEWWEINRGPLPDCCPLPEPVPDFWPKKVSQSPQGFLVTTDGTAVRVLASGFLVPLFDTPDTEFPGGVVEIMKPFRAYYVIHKQADSLLVVEPPFNLQSQRFWVRQRQCYVWATDLAVEMKKDFPVYASEEQARSGGKPLLPSKKYVSIQELPGIPGEGKSPPLSKLPLLIRKGDVAALLCPVHGGELCWVNLTKAGNSISF